MLTLNKQIKAVQIAGVLHKIWDTTDDNDNPCVFCSCGEKYLVNFHNLPKEEGFEESLKLAIAETHILDVSGQEPLVPNPESQMLDDLGWFWNKNLQNTITLSSGMEVTNFRKDGMEEVSANYLAYVYAPGSVYIAGFIGYIEGEDEYMFLPMPDTGWSIMDMAEITKIMSEIPDAFT